jgi:hypothetical protein
MLKKSTGVIIGPSGIGKVHLRELINFGFKNIGLIGKKFKKNRISDLIIKHKDISFYNLKSIKEIKKIKPRIINLCSPTKYHYDQILIIKNLCKNLIIEKPILWIKNNKVSNLAITKNLLSKKSNNIYVNLPMISLAKQIKKKNKILKIKRLNFNYFTKGKNQFENIPIDLLPHALSFLLTLKSNNLKYFKIIEVYKKKNIWKCKIIINDCLCKFHFKQDHKRLDSRLSFRINDDIYLRKQIIKNGIYVNKILKNKEKIFNIKNPMSDYLSLILKNLNKKNILKKNNSITINLVEIMEELVNY